jgi:hypothetical protein
MLIYRTGLNKPLAQFSPAAISFSPRILISPSVLFVVNMLAIESYITYIYKVK